jgi:hypothetical protein
MTNSVEILGGPSSFNIIATTAKFRTDNPKLYGAFLAGLKDATDFINRDKSAAADTYLRLSNDKSPKEEVLALMNDKDVKFTTEVFNLGVFTDFMAKVGSLKNPPKDWRTEMVFPEATAATDGAGASPSLRGTPPARRAGARFGRPSPGAHPSLDRTGQGRPPWARRSGVRPRHPPSIGIGGSL